MATWQQLGAESGDGVTSCSVQVGPQQPHRPGGRRLEQGGTGAGCVKVQGEGGAGVQVPGEDQIRNPSPDSRVTPHSTGCSRRPMGGRAVVT